MDRRYYRKSYTGFGSSYRRSYYGAGCMFCTGVSEFEESHKRHQCQEFRQLKKNTSYLPYVKATLNDNDELGFAAAGFLLWKRVDKDDAQVLMARENRERGDLLNFLGGKRLRKADTAIDVAWTKVNAESGCQLSSESLEGMKHAPLVHWSGRSSKYALYIYEVTSWRDKEVDVLAAGLRKEGVKRLEWVSCESLNSSFFTNRELHDFAQEMVQTLSDPSCNVLENLKELFETAKQASKATKCADDTSSDVLFDFDIITAIISSANRVKSFPPCRDPITWGYLADAVKLLPKNDIRKLQLKYHPDRLGRSLGREPTDLEKKLGLKAMQIFNRIMEMTKDSKSQPSRSACTGDLFNTIKELNALIKKYTGNDDADCKEKVAAAITAKLSEIKIK